MSSVIMDFFHNLSLNSGGGGSSEFMDELMWDNNTTSATAFSVISASGIGKYAPISQIINKPIILKFSLTYTVSTSSFKYIRDPANLDIYSADIDDVLTIRPSGDYNSHGSTILSLNYNFNAFTANIIDITKSSKYPNITFFALINNGRYTTDSYMTYQKGLMSKLYDAVITNYADQTEIIVDLYIYIDPINRLIQMYHTDYMDPNNLLHSMILPKWLCPETGVRIYYNIMNNSNYGEIATWDTSKESGNVIIPGSNFNPNITIDNTDLLTSFNKLE